MRRGREADLGRLLRGVAVPDELGAQERAWGVARTAYAGRLSVPPRRSRLRYAPVPALLLIVAAVLELTPAGATVHHWLASALSPRLPQTTNVLSLPVRGSRVLVTAPAGTWIVKARGEKRSLGIWDYASWSPRGLYVVAASADSLATLDPSGAVAWGLALPNVQYPRWYEPRGSYNSRIAFIKDGSLSVITGDKQPRDHIAGQAWSWVVASDVASIAPAWRPGSSYELAYASVKRRIVLADSESRLRLWSSRALPERPIALGFSGDGSRLLALTRHAASIFDATGRPLGSVAAGAGAQLVDGALSPDGRTLALLSDRTVTLVGAGAALGSSQPGFTARGGGLRQLAWSPDGQWLLVTWPRADEWVFIHATGTPSDQIISHISQQFHGAFPRIDGWCCTAAGGAS